MKTLLRTVIIHEDAEAAQSARSLIEKLGSKLGLHFAGATWTFPLLADGELQKKATREIGKADAVIVAAHKLTIMPAHISKWIERCRNEGRNQTAWLFLTQYPREPDHAAPFRWETAGSSGFLGDELTFDSTPTINSAVGSRSPVMEVAANSFVQRGWGINE